jgi:hypothetical protein
LIIASKEKTDWRKVYLQIEDPIRAARVVWPIRQSRLLAKSDSAMADLLISDTPFEAENGLGTSATQSTLPLTQSTMIYLLQKNTSPKTL